MRAKTSGPASVPWARASSAARATCSPRQGLQRRSMRWTMGDGGGRLELFLPLTRSPVPPFPPCPPPPFPPATLSPPPPLLICPLPPRAVFPPHKRAPVAPPHPPLHL